MWFGQAHRARKKPLMPRKRFLILARTPKEGPSCPKFWQRIVRSKHFRPFWALVDDRQRAGLAAKPPGMGPGDLLSFAIAFALRGARKLVRGLRELTEEERYRVADDVVHRLKLHGDPWRLSEDWPSPGKGHSTL
jgi:hypothetical protein